MGLTKVSTDGVKDDAITKAKIPANQIETSELASSSVTNVKIAAGNVDNTAIGNNQVSLNKLVQGTSSNDGKFLRANNGADPTFETVNTDLVSDTSPQLGGDLASNGNDIDFADGDKAVFGTGEDMKIFHSSDVNQITTGTKVFKIFGGGSNNKTIFATDTDNSAELYFDNSKKLETTTIGANLTGSLLINTNTTSGISGSADDLVIGSISDTVSRGLTIATSADCTIRFADAGDNAMGRIQYLNNTDVMSLHTANTKRLQIDADGLKFGSDTAAANALDDYEEGTWTPSLTNTTNTGTSSGRVNIYRKIGSVVFFSFDIFQTNNNMSININGNTQITGLPFNTLSSFNSTMTVATYFSDGSGQQMANYIETTPKIVLHGNGEKYNIRHLWGHGFYSTS